MVRELKRKGFRFGDGKFAEGNDIAAKEYDVEKIKHLASIQCTTGEIATQVGCSVDTLNRRFHDIMLEARDAGKALLRQNQIKYACKGNSSMLTLLGKNWLGQFEKAPEEESKTVININITPIP